MVITKTVSTNGDLLQMSIGELNNENDLELAIKILNREILSPTSPPLTINISSSVDESGGTK